MENIFDQLIESYIKDQVGVSDHILDPTLSKSLQVNLNALYSNSQLKNAGTGNDDLASINKLIRGDKIFWLDKIHHDQFEDAFFLLIDEFVSHLNATCYTGITGYEFHYALYEKGSFYKRHLDQFNTNKDRAFTVIFYLNENWVVADGGQLCVHNNDTMQIIAPLNGRCVFFKSSELEHEVLLTEKPRLSITGWLKTNSA